MQLKLLLSIRWYYNYLFTLILKRTKMRTKLFFACLMIFALLAPTTFGTNSNSESKNLTNSNKKENKLSEEEVSRLTKRVEEIRDMDKSNLTVIEKRELRKELKTTKENVRKDGGYIYVSAGTVIIILLLIILLT